MSMESIQHWYVPHAEENTLLIAIKYQLAEAQFSKEIQPSRVCPNASTPHLLMVLALISFLTRVTSLLTKHN